MPIQGLTHQERMPVIGSLRKGAEKRPGRPPKDLDHFRFEGISRDIEERFREAYGDAPSIITGIIPYETVDEAWQAWMLWFVRSGLKAKCDGKTCIAWRRQNDPEIIHEPVPCFGLAGGPGCECKPKGRLELMLPKLRAFGTVELHTGSRIDIERIDRVLRMAERFARERGSTAKGLPIKLSRHEEEITFSDGGKRRSTKKHLIRAELDIELLDRAGRLAIATGMPLLEASHDAEEMEDWEVEFEEEEAAGIEEPHFLDEQPLRREQKP